MLPDAVTTEITNNHLVKKFTFFEELYKNGSRYGVSESQVLQWAADAGGPGYHIITSTKGFSTDSTDYDKLGGVEKCMKMQVMFVRQKQQLRCVVTRRPDDAGLVVMLNKAFGPGTYIFGLCTSQLWDTIYQLDVEPLFIEARANELGNTVSSSASVKDNVKDSEARQIYNHMIMLGINRGASDIHIIPCSSECRILYRIDGENYQLMRIPLSIAERIANILMTDGGVPNKGPNTTQDGKIRYVPPGTSDGSQGRDLRFSFMPTRNGKDINVRFLNNRLYTFSELGMSKENVETYESLLDRSQGLIMQVGPTGSGKSTTLYAGLNYIHDKSLRNIITIEDPVEIKMDGITQVDVNEDTKLTFARAARQFLRHDVDVGVIGEIRDEETALEAVRSAATGHLVISSLHSNDSLGVLERLFRLGVDPYSLSEVLVAVMGQRLVRRLCPKCKEAYEVTREEGLLGEMGLPTRIDKMTFYRPVGCEHCNNLGYKGRIAVNEILVIDRTLRDMIQRHETRKTMEDHLRDRGFKTMFVDARDKVIEGVTSAEELRPMMYDTLAYK